MLIQTQHTASSDNRCFPLALAGDRGDLPPRTPRGASLLFSDSNENGQEQQPIDLVEPDIPTNFDDLTDAELAELIRSLIAQAAAFYESGIFFEDGEHLQPEQAEKASHFISFHVRYTPGMYGGSPVTPVAYRTSLFSKSLEGGAQ